MLKCLLDLPLDLHLPIVYARRDHFCAWTSPESGINSGRGIYIYIYIIQRSVSIAGSLFELIEIYVVGQFQTFLNINELEKHSHGFEECFRIQYFFSAISSFFRLNTDIIAKMLNYNNSNISIPGVTLGRGCLRVRQTNLLQRLTS